MERVRIESTYVPKWDDVEKTVLWMCEHHFWRVQGWLEFDDLYQEAALKFCEVAERVSDHRYSVANRAHFTGLLRSSILWRIYDIARSKRIKQTASLSTSSQESGDPLEDVVAPRSVEIEGRGEDAVALADLMMDLEITGSQKVRDFLKDLRRQEQACVCAS